MSATESSVTSARDLAELAKRITTAELARNLPRLEPRLAQGGMLWVSWPKKTSKLFVDLTEDGIRKLCLPRGLVDVKVCAVDNDWSGLKLMRRKR